MADKDPWWKALLSVFLTFIGGLISSNRAATKSVETSQRIADADAKGPHTAPDAEQRLRDHNF